MPKKDSGGSTTSTMTVGETGKEIPQAPAKQLSDIEKDDETRTVVFTGGADSTYLLYRLLEQHPKEKIIPVWFEAGNNAEQVEKIKGTCQFLGLNPVFVKKDTVPFSAHEYLFDLAEFTFNEGISKMSVPLINDEVLSNPPIEGTGIGVINEIETAISLKHRNPYNTVENELALKFHITMDIVGLTKDVIFKRLVRKHKFDITKLYRHKQVPKDKEDTQTIETNKIIDRIYKRGLKASGLPKEKQNEILGIPNTQVLTAATKKSDADSRTKPENELNQQISTAKAEQESKPIAQ